MSKDVARKGSLKGGLASVFGGNEPKTPAPVGVETSAPLAELPVEQAAPVVKKKPGKPRPALKKATAVVTREKGVKMAPGAASEIKKERNQSFSLQIPLSLHERLKHFNDNYALRHESMTQVILSGLEMKLEELEKRAGIAK